MPNDIRPCSLETAEGDSLAFKSEYLLEYAEKELGLRRRAGQRQMVRVISEVLEGKEKFAVVEAGTGTGKTYAYLIPVCYYCLMDDKRAVISTGTKTLQQQLIGKDLPFISNLFRAVTGKQLRFTLLFGRSNYLCPRLLDEELDQRQLRLQLVKDRETEFLLDVAEWLGEGGSGIWEDLPGISEDKRKYWLKVCADSDEVFCAACDEQECPWLKARRRAASAQIVVVNHWLAAADLVLASEADLRLFGEAKPAVLVVDEAHNFREVVKTSNQVVFSQDHLRHIMQGFEQLEKRIPFVSGQPTAEIRQLWEMVMQSTSELDDWAGMFLGSDSIKPLKPQTIRQPVVEKLETTLQAFLGLAEEKLRDYRKELASWQDHSEELSDDRISEEVLRLLNRAHRLGESLEGLKKGFERGVKLSNHYLVAGESGDVCCVEKAPGIRFVAWPFDPVPALTDLYEMYDKVVLTSATLFPASSPAAIEWFLNRNGISASKARVSSLPSPFDYTRQMEAFILADSSLNPGGSNPQRLQALGKTVLKTVESSQGGVLVLCTSYAELRAVAAYLAKNLPRNRCLFVQGEAGKSELLQQFQAHGRAVLVGVASFWQGVDIPGDALKTLFIARIPFPVPEDPDIQAETHFARNRWWSEVFVPRACLTMKQGIGRLIRTESDTGTVIIADPRAAQRHRHLVESCLPVKPSILTLDEFQYEVRSENECQKNS